MLETILTGFTSIRLCLALVSLNPILFTVELWTEQDSMTQRLKLLLKTPLLPQKVWPSS